MDKKLPKKENTTIDQLASMVARGFDSLSKDFSGRMDKLDKKIDDVEERLTNKMHGIERRIDDLALNRATRDEMKILDVRITRVEKKVGLKR